MSGIVPSGLPPIIDGGTPLREMEANYEKLQHRDDAKLPPLPPAFDRDPVRPLEVVPSSDVTPREQLVRVVDQIRKERGQLAPSQSTFPGLAGWEPSREGGL